jgi:hypothetical protein
VSWTPAHRTARLVAALAICALALGACGDDDEDGGGSGSATSPSTTTTTPDATSLRVVVRGDGPSSPARTRTIECDSVGPDADSLACRRLATVTPRSLGPVPGDVACPEIFGGPAVATVSGTLRGERVRASFDLSDGCEIGRWRDNAALLGQPPGNPPGP